MSMLSEIQESLLVEGTSLEFPLLRLRFLASRMGSVVLEDWVRHEIEGYPEGTDVPSYRRTDIIYRGTFTDGYRTLNDVPIPNAVIAQHGGKHWLSREFRESMGVIDATVARADKRAEYSIDAANLLLLIQNKIYEGMPCIMVRGLFDISAFVKIQSAVRAKMLELTIKFEKELPLVGNITRGATIDALPATDVAAANNATQAVVYNYNGPVTNITTSGAVSDVNINFTQVNVEKLIGDLTRGGIPNVDALELGRIIRDEKPDDGEQPLGRRTRGWINEKVGEAGKTVWGMGKVVPTSIVTEAVKKYYNL